MRLKLRLRLHRGGSISSEEMIEPRVKRPRGSVGSGGLGTVPFLHGLDLVLALRLSLGRLGVASA